MLGCSFERNEFEEHRIIAGRISGAFVPCFTMSWHGRRRGPFL